MRTRLILIMAVALLVLALPQRSSAHAELVTATPAAGSTVATAPSVVSAVFSQQLAPDESTMTVEDASGVRVDTDDASVDATDSDGTTMTVSLKDGLAAGTYTVRWTTLSAEDGETAEGRFTFTVSGSAAGGQAASPAPSASGAASPRPSASTSATASAAAASAQASAAGGTAPGQATTLPETGATSLALSVVSIATLALILGATIRGRRRSAS